MFSPCPTARSVRRSRVDRSAALLMSNSVGLVHGDVRPGVERVATEVIDNVEHVRDKDKEADQKRQLQNGRTQSTARKVIHHKMRQQSIMRQQGIEERWGSLPLVPDNTPEHLWMRNRAADGEHAGGEELVSLLVPLGTRAELCLLRGRKRGGAARKQP